MKKRQSHKILKEEKSIKWKTKAMNFGVLYGISNFELQKIFNKGDRINANNN